MSSEISAAPVNPTKKGKLNPLSITDYTITSGFWALQQTLNRTSTIPHCDASLEKVGWVENFRSAARGTLATDRSGRLFTDSEIYKTMEAIAWETLRCDSPELTKRFGELADIVADSQHDDGYINTYYGYDGGPDRYSDMEWGHELYCYGHLIQAAVASMRSGGPESIMNVAKQLADHVCRTFGTEGRQTICGHPEIETALVELYRATGEKRYLDQAKIFVDRRGHQVLDDTMYKGRDYYQDNVPVREAEVLVGHSVRALYLAAGAIDVAVETVDSDLLFAVKAQYDRTLARRTYLTGGMGSNHHGETYGDDFELPSERAYAETCAAVASVHVAWRLLLATGETRYADVIERTLYNSIVSSPSVDGTKFFYVNALQRRTPGIEPEVDIPSLRRTDGRRASWFTTSCCPTNLARTLSSLSGYLATSDDEGIQLHQYAAGIIGTNFGAGRSAVLSVETEYPVSGDIVIRVDETDGQPWALTLRVPDWCREATLDDGDSSRSVATGAIVVNRSWKVGDVIRLTLDMTPQFIVADPRIGSLHGNVAIHRGPIVYAMESSDQPGIDLDLVELDTGSAPADSITIPELGDVVSVTAKGRVRSLIDCPFPYSSTPPSGDSVDSGPFTFIPYYRWANRESSTMRVWVPEMSS